MMAAPTQELIEVEAKDGEKISVAKEALLMNRMIQDMFESLAALNKGTSSGVVVPLKKFSAFHLRMVFEFCNHSMGKPPPDEHYSDALSDWESNYVNTMSHADRLQVLTAADFLQNKALSKCLIKGIVLLLEGAIPSEIKAICDAPDEATATDAEIEDARQTILAEQAKHVMIQTTVALASGGNGLIYNNNNNK